MGEITAKLPPTRVEEAKADVAQKAAEATTQAGQRVAEEVRREQTANVAALGQNETARLVEEASLTTQDGRTMTAERACTDKENDSSLALNSSRGIESAQPVGASEPATAQLARL